VRRVDAEEIKERNTIPPAQEEEPACQYKNHRQDVHHEIYVEIARHILCIRNEHVSWMLREIPHPVCVEAHNNYRNILAEPPKELQDSP
jgi:hypothetical protein